MLAKAVGGDEDDDASGQTVLFAEAQAGAVNKFGNDFFEVFKTVDFGFKTAGTENAFLNFGIFKFNAGNAVQLLQSLFGQNTKTLANQRARRGSQFGSGKMPMKLSFLTSLRPMPQTSPTSSF